MATDASQALGNIPENLKQLLAATAEEYKWPPQKLESVEKALREKQWGPQQVAEIERTIREEKWAPIDIADVEKAYRHNGGKLSRDAFANSPNPKLKKMAAETRSVNIDVNIHINC